MPPLVFLDTETIGLDPDIHGIWEVGAIWRADHTSDPDLDVEYVWQLPVDPDAADPKALEINHFHERRWGPNALTRKHDFANTFTSLTHGAVLVVNNPTFDIPRLEALVRQYYDHTWHYHPRDVQDLAVGYLKGIRATMASTVVGRDLVDPGPPPWSGHQILKFFGIEPGDHTALGDARTVRDLWDRLQ
jgi:DNA polymerase III epsilon subunit-like protein